MSVTFGRVPHPVYQDRPITKPDGFGQDNLGQRSVKGVVYHRMIGSLWGTDGYFRLPTTGALTDYGVGTAAQDGAANDGVILRWNDPLGRQSGWASGTWDANYAYGDGKAFVEKYAPSSGIGVSVINRDQASIEISGLTYTTPITEATKRAVAALSAYWADQYHIPWDKYPVAPQDGFSFVRWHNEFGPDHGQKPCPGSVVEDATPEIIELTRAILKQYQESNAPGGETPVPPTTPDVYPLGMDDGIAEYLFGPKFNPKGPVSKKWIARGKAIGCWPRLEEIKTFDTRTYYRFSDGWTLWKSGNGAVKELI